MTQLKLQRWRSSYSNRMYEAAMPVNRRTYQYLSAHVVWLTFNVFHPTFETLRVTADVQTS